MARGRAWAGDMARGESMKRAWYGDMARVRGHGMQAGIKKLVMKWYV
jgi:hypothetical protein